MNNTMSEEKKTEEGKDVSRRGFVKSAATGIVGLVVGAGLGYGAAASMAPAGKPGATSTVTITATQTQTGTGAAVVKKRPAGATVEERAINAAKEFMARNNVPAGTKISCLTTTGMIAAIEAATKRFTDATGLKYEGIGVPHEEVFTKAMLEATQRSGQYAALCIRPRMLGEFVGAGVVAEMSDWMWYYDAKLYGEPDGYPFPHSITQIENIGGGKYCMPNDLDIGAAVYRKDILFGEADKFEKQYGYKAKTAEVFKEYYDISEFLHRPPAMYGNGEARSIGNGYMPFQMYFYNKRSPVMPWFDANMNPMINTKEGIQAIEEYLSLKKFQHPDIIKWSYTEQIANFVKNGNIGCGFWPPSMDHFVWSDPDSKVKGKTIVGPPIGTKQADGTILRRGLCMGGWALFAVSTWKWPELVYLWAQCTAGPEQQVVGATCAGSWQDAARLNEFGKKADKRFIDYYAGPDSLIYEIGEKACGVTPAMLAINGENEYYLTMDKELNRAFMGEIDAATAAKNTEATWNKTTDRIGRAKQIW